ncbi:MAG: aldo/keto reductase [Pseudomonadota bacterium]
MTLRWGILGTGNIARTFARAADQSSRNELVAVGSRTQDQARAFADKQSGAVAAMSYAELLQAPEVDAVYVATPHPTHAGLTIAALEAGKHVLCEKPLGLNHAEVMAMVDAARESERFLMEAFMYRCHPQTERLLELVRDGAIGELRHLSASFGFQVPEQPESRLFANSLGGGGIMDVGCYPISVARLFAGREPAELTGTAHLGATGVDHWACASLAFEGGLSAQLATGITLNLDNAIELYGSEGRISVPNPWMGSDADGTWAFTLTRQGSEPEKITGQAEPLYVLEIDHVADCVADGTLSSPAMSWEDSLGNARCLDDWRKAAGVRFEPETTAGHPGPIRGTLKRPKMLAMAGSVPGLERPVSRLVMGCDNQPGMAHAAILWDHYFSLGGNCFDTAYIYGGGRMETLLGAWQEARGIRDEIVIIGKGAHTPDDHPEAIAPQLAESLTRLRTDAVDVYFLHRDNLDVPVGEFVDAVNVEIRAGRIRTWGGSNWTLERVKAANAYAAETGQQAMSAISNNFSLAHMVKALWPGVKTATEPAFRAYLAETGMALMPWSSQARGFFTPWAEEVMAQTGRENPVITGVQPTMAELAETWFSEDNFERRRRAVSLAEERGVTPIQVALAYVIAQPVPCFPLIGPRQLEETRSSLAALDVSLSAAECAWLNLED